MLLHVVLATPGLLQQKIKNTKNTHFSLLKKKKSQTEKNLIITKEFAVVYEKVFILVLDKKFKMDQLIFEVFDLQINEGSLITKYEKLAQYLSTADIIPLKCGLLRRFSSKIINDEYSLYLINRLPQMWIKIMSKKQVIPIVYGEIEQYVSFSADRKVINYYDPDLGIILPFCIHTKRSKNK